MNLRFSHMDPKVASDDIKDVLDDEFRRYGEFEVRHSLSILIMNTWAISDEYSGKFGKFKAGRTSIFSAGHFAGRPLKR